MLFKRSFGLSALVLKGKGSSKWAERQSSDPWVKRAQSEGFRARSAYKLIEMNTQFQLLKPGQAVVECGSAPGAWSQVAAKAINAEGQYSNKGQIGTLVGCDLLNMEPVEGLKFIRGDFTQETVRDKMRELCGQRPLDLVLSDMAPNASGHGGQSHDAIVNLAYDVIKFSLEHSKIGGKLLIKIWDGASKERMVKDLERFFHYVKVIKPSASRHESAEIYILAQDFKGATKVS